MVLVRHLFDVRPKTIPRFKLNKELADSTPVLFSQLSFFGLEI